MEEEILHYCVTNMPGAVGRTSTFAFATSRSLGPGNRPSGIEAAARDLRPVARANQPLQREITNKPVGRDVWADVFAAIQSGVKRRLSADVADERR